MTEPAPADLFRGTITFDQLAERIESIDIGSTVAEMRPGFKRLMLGDDPTVDQRPVMKFNGVSARVTGRRGAENADLGGARDRVWVWFHGGGFVFGSPETHIRPTEKFAALTGDAVVSPAYRLAPEHTWPAQLEDSLAVAHALQERGYLVGLAGDSAGGQLALDTALHLAEEGNPAVSLALFSPNTDRTGLSETRGPNSETDPMNTDANDRQLGKMCFGDRPVQDPDVSPVLGNLGSLPRTHIEVGGLEVLLGDSKVLHRRAKDAGAPISYHETPEAFHMWQLWTPWLQEADASLSRTADALRL